MSPTNKNNETARKYLVFTVEPFNQLHYGNSGGQALFPWYVNTDRCKVITMNFWWVSTATETDQVVVITNDDTTVACYPSSIAIPLLSLHLKNILERFRTGEHLRSMLKHAADILSLFGLSYHCLVSVHCFVL